jgi:hypothetical protein
MPRALSHSRQSSWHSVWYTGWSALAIGGKSPHGKPESPTPEQEPAVFEPRRDVFQEARSFECMVGISGRSDRAKTRDQPPDQPPHSKQTLMQAMVEGCRHLAGIRDVVPSALGCACGHVGCCDQSPTRTGRSHPIIEANEPPEGWGWCYVDEIFFDLSDRPTPRPGPIPRFY